MPRIELEAYWDGEAWCARNRRYSIYTYADTLDELLDNVREAVQVYYEGESQVSDPVRILLKVRFDVPQMATRSR